MRIQTIFAVSTFLMIGITGQAQAVNPQSHNLLELTHSNSMMSAQVGHNGSSQPPYGNGRRFAEMNSSIHQDNIIPRRGSGR